MKIEIEELVALINVIWSGDFGAGDNADVGAVAADAGAGDNADAAAGDNADAGALAIERQSAQASADSDELE